MQTFSEEVIEFSRSQAVNFITPKMGYLVDSIQAVRSLNPPCAIYTRTINKLWDLPDGSLAVSFYATREDFQRLREDEAKQRGGYYQFSILFLGDFKEMFAFFASTQLEEQRNIAIALFEEFSKSRIGHNPEFQAIRERAPNMDAFCNPFKDCVGDEMLRAFKEAGLLP
ncbi:MAG: hypothetical protein RL518_816 [Pseudomonadota bacterium]|jgi:hypothetical protein